MFGIVADVWVGIGVDLLCELERERIESKIATFDLGKFFEPAMNLVVVLDASIGGLDRKAMAIGTRSKGRLHVKSRARVVHPWSIDDTAGSIFTDLKRQEISQIDATCLLQHRQGLARVSRNHEIDVLRGPSALETELEPNTALHHGVWDVPAYPKRVALHHGELLEPRGYLPQERGPEASRIRI